MVGVVLEERSTLNALPQLRGNKAEDPMAMDPSIAAATRGSISDPSHAAPTAVAERLGREARSAWPKVVLGVASGIETIATTQKARPRHEESTRA